MAEAAPLAHKNMAMLIDSHCHLDYLARDEDLDGVVARARDAGLGGMVTICTKVSEFDEIRGIAEKYDDIWCTVGIHPHEADAEPEVSAERLIELAAHVQAARKRQVFSDPE